MENTNFDGVFKFTNVSDKDFTVMWNSKEYTFPAKSTCPLIISGETLENIQNIRKRFALKFAQRELAKSKEGMALEKEGAKHFMPATYNESILEKYIETCLNPLPIAQASVKVVEKKKTKFIDNGTMVVGEGQGTKAISEGFNDYVPPELGAMSE